MKYVEIGARREAYSVDDVAGSTLTLGELIDVLEDLEDEVGEDAPVILSHDNGYTYGSIHEGYISIEETDKELEDEEEEEEVEVDDEFKESYPHTGNSAHSAGSGITADDDEDELDESWSGDDRAMERDWKLAYDDEDEDFECDDDFGEHENTYDVDEAYSFKGLNDRFGGKTLAESLHPKVIKKKKK